MAIPDGFLLNNNNHFNVFSLLPSNAFQERRTRFDVSSECNDADEWSYFTFLSFGHWNLFGFWNL